MKNANSSNNTPRQRLHSAAIVAIILLLGLNAYLLYNTYRQGQQKAELSSQLEESEQLKADLEKQYYQALSDLEEQRGQNQELNELIDRQKEELKLQKARIEGMLGDNRKLREARNEIRRLTAQVDQYLAQINQLKSENQVLLAQNTELAASNERLDSNLSTAQRINEELAEEQTNLLSEKENLEKEKASLSQKVTQASVIRVADVEVEGQRVRKNGKTARKRAARSVEQLQIWFTTTPNEIARAGTETFLLRILNPAGETLALEALGSGVFVRSDNGQQVRFTRTAEVNYDQQPDTHCLTWAPGQPFEAGDYRVEIYNKGYLSGEGTFSLR